MINYGGVINLQLNNLPSGNYKTRLLNSFGQVVLIKIITHAVGNAIEKIALSKQIAKGIYNLEIINPDNGRTKISVVYQ